jgi:hypothetical protein
MTLSILFVPHSNSYICVLRVRNHNKIKIKIVNGYHTVSPSTFHIHDDYVTNSMIWHSDQSNHWQQASSYTTIALIQVCFTPFECCSNVNSVGNCIEVTHTHTQCIFRHQLKLTVSSVFQSSSNWCLKVPFYWHGTFGKILVESLIQMFIVHDWCDFSFVVMMWSPFLLPHWQFRD